MDGCEHPLLYLSGSGRASQETAISGSFSKLLLASAIVSRFGGCLWDRFPGMAVSALNFVSVTPSMGVLFSPLKMDQTIHTMILLLLEFHLVCELYLGYSEQH